MDGALFATIVLIIGWLLDNCHSLRSKMESQFYFEFLKWPMIFSGIYLTFLLTHLRSFCSFQMLTFASTFKFGRVLFSSSFYILDSTPLSEEQLANVFSCTVGYLFTLLIVSHCKLIFIDTSSKVYTKESLVKKEHI